MLYTILGYDFDCKEFKYQGRIVNGLAFEIKTNEKISMKNIHNISVELSKKYGFIVRLHQNARGIKVEPYKSYVLVPCRDAPWQLEQLEISHKALMKHTDCFGDEISRSPSTQYYLE